MEALSLRCRPDDIGSQTSGPDLTRCCIAPQGSVFGAVCDFLGDRLSTGSPCAIGPLSCLSVLSVYNVGVLWPNGWVDQHETWHGGRPRSRPHCFRWGPSSPSKRGQRPPIFGPCLLWPNGWMDQDAIWSGGRSPTRRHCVRRGPSSHRQKKGAQQPPLFGACIVAKRLDGSRYHLVRSRPRSSPDDMGIQLPLKRCTAPRATFRSMSIVVSQTVAHLSHC